MKKPIVFGKYLLLERVNVGGMAEVFIAKAFGVEGFERILAIKKILPTMAEDVEFITMFIDEARISVQLNHANIVHIHELGRHDDAYFIAMEYVAGRDLRTLLEWYRRRKEVMPTAQAVLIASKLCEGLDYAHRKRDARGLELGIIHRDVSPQNILVSYEGEVKIIDFGIAKAANRSQTTQAGILKGKFGYMSPEQVRGLPIDRRSDVFAVGVMLYEMLTGEKLFVGESDFSTLEKVRDADVPPLTRYNPNIPRGLENVVMKALAREPGDRYQWASDLQEDLMRFLLSGEAIYSAKHLSAFMKEAFSEDLIREGEKMERFAAIERPANIEATGIVGKLDRPKFRKPNGTLPPGVGEVELTDGGIPKTTVPGRIGDGDTASDKTQIVESVHANGEAPTTISPSRPNRMGSLDERSLDGSSALEALEVSGVYSRGSEVDALGEGSVAPTSTERPLERSAGNTPRPKIIIGENTGYSGDTMIRPNLTRDEVPAARSETLESNRALPSSQPRRHTSLENEFYADAGNPASWPQDSDSGDDDLGPEVPTQGAGSTGLSQLRRSKKTLPRLIFVLSTVVAALLVIGVYLKMTTRVQLVVMVEPKVPFMVSVNGKLYEGSSAVAVKPGEYDVEVLPRQDGFLKDKQRLKLESGERIHKVTLKTVPSAVLIRPPEPAAVPDAGAVAAVPQPGPSPGPTPVPTPSSEGVTPPREFTINFVCAERGVEVFVDGKSVGRTPNAKAHGLLFDRTHQVQAIKKGFQVMNLEVLNSDRSPVVQQVLVMVPEGGSEVRPGPKPSKSDSAPKQQPSPPRPAPAPPSKPVAAAPKPVPAPAPVPAPIPAPAPDPPPAPAAAKAKGKFACSTKPPGAEVFINGKPTGQNTPIALSNALELPVGKHKVTFKLEGKVTGPIEINVTENNIEKLVGVELP